MSIDTTTNKSANTSAAKPLTSKYRLSMSAAQILTLLDLAKRAFPSSTTLAEQEDIYSCIQYLSNYKTKIDNDCIRPGYTNKGRAANLADVSLPDLGIATDTASSTSNTSNHTSTAGIISLASKEELWQRAYDKFSKDPSSCSPAEITAANEYRFVNNLMTPEEEAAFEAAVS